MDVNLTQNVLPPSVHDKNLEEDIVTNHLDDDIEDYLHVEKGK